MRRPELWPLHPAPVEAESLSSWLNRLASTYQMNTSEFLEHALGHQPLRDQQLDFDPPTPLLAELILHSGVDRNRLKQMCVAGWVPWLLDSTAPEPGSYQTYVHQFSVLLPPTRRKIYAPAQWLPWTPEDRIRRACPECLESSGSVVFQLFWQFPLMLSCPRHACWIELYEGQPPEYFRWAAPARNDPTVPPAVASMDRRTWQAVTTGKVELPRRSVHAGVWFRLLRTLLDELSAAQGQCGGQLRDVHLIWERTGHPFRAGLHAWRSFENLKWPIQQQLLEAAAMAIELIENDSVSALGSTAHLLLPEPDRKVDDGTSHEKVKVAPKTGKRPTQEELWKEAVNSLDAVIEAAKHDPLVAKQLYDFMLVGCKSEGAVRLLQQNFAELEISLTFLSHTVDANPFYMT